MLDYLTGFLFVLLSIVFFYLLGSSLRKKTESFSLNFLVGYIFYSFLIALFLIPIQIFRFSWNLAFAITIILFLLSSAFIAYSIISQKISFTKFALKEMFKNNYFLFVTSFALVFVFLLQFDLIWINNHLDDGYYLVKIATLPYLENPFTTTYATGLPAAATSFDSYALSSYELEHSVYLYLLHMDPVVYCRIFLNAFNYFLAASTVSAFTESIFLEKKYFNKKMFQYFGMILLFFSFEYLYMQTKGLFTVQDAWQFSSAMWFGSSIPRVLGIMWIILLFVNIKEISWKQILGAGVICVVLISKSSIALPTVIITGVAFLIAYALTSEKKNIKFGIFLIALLIVLGVLLPDSTTRNDLILSIFQSDFKSFLFIGCVLLAALGSILFFRNKMVRRTMLTLLLSYLLIAVPEINDTFECVSMYDFVARRYQTTLIYTTVIIAFIFFIIFCLKYLKPLQKVLIPASFLLLLSGAVLTTIPVYGNPLNTLSVMKNNPKIIPESTVELSKELERLAIENGELNVLCPDWVNVDNHRHALSVMLRTYAPDVNVVTALTRYSSVSEDNEFYGFNAEDQGAYTLFASNPDDTNYYNLDTVLNKYPINCLVTPTQGFEQYAKSSGYQFVSKTNMYSIYLKI